MITTIIKAQTPHLNSVVHKMSTLQKAPITLFVLLLITVQTYAVTALLAAATHNCSYAFYSRAKTFTHKSSPEDLGTCEWRITVSPNEKIILNVTDMFIPKSPNCTQGHVEIRDGYWSSSPLLGRFCGGENSSETAALPVLSTSNKMLVSYTNLNSGIGQGFVASYEGICGGTLFVDNRTTFSSPNYPGVYPFNKKCIWRIVVPDDFYVAITFNYFSVEYQNNCLYDYVEVREGPLMRGKTLGTYCNANPPSSIVVAESSEIFVKFVSDSTVTLGGFEATVTMGVNECAKNNHGCSQLCVNTNEGYKCACYNGFELHSNGKWCEVACGGNLTNSIGRINSPSYPYSYPANRSCLWKIQTLQESTIKLNFLEFSLEDGVTNGTSVQCAKDWLKVSSVGRGNPLEAPSRYCQGSGSSEVLTLQGTYCGATLPDPITSEGSELTVAFHSDATIQGGGFAISYKIDVDGCLINNGNCHYQCSNNGTTSCVCPTNFNLKPNGRDCQNTANCIYQLSTPNGVISSPSYPNAYPLNKMCYWNFKTTPGHRLNITFNAFQFENHTTCAYDYLIFYDGSSSTNSTLGKFCGSVLPPQFNSSTNELYAVFRSDASNHFTGFQATYSTVCGGNLTAGSTEKYIYSHADYGYGNYDNRMFCEWTIQAPVGKKVTLSFLSFLLESGASCQFDYVQIFDKPGALVSLGKYCWTQKPPRICSTGDTLVVRFATDGSVVHKGFSLVYKSTD